MIAREGRGLIVAAFAVTAAALAAALLLLHPVYWIVLIAAAVATLVLILFFRDPDRVAPNASGLILAPADGWVATVEEAPDHPFVGMRPMRVSIFLSLFDVHVNRVPISGRVVFVTHRSGRFTAAFCGRAADENEQTEIAIVSDQGDRVAFRQIAGWIARRIVCRLEAQQRVEAGQRCGIIKFGSRVDLFLPPGSTVGVKKGDRVMAGRSVIGALPPHGLAAF